MRFHGATLAPARMDEDEETKEPTPEEADAEETARSAALFADELADAALATSGTDTYSSSELRLLRWARAVCGCVGVEVDGFKLSFADGTALCALINAYAPRLLPLRAIRRPPTTLDVPGAPASWRSVSYGYLLRERVGSDGAGPDDEIAAEALEARAQATAACKANFKLASDVCRALGGVPELTFGPSDVASAGGPDAKVVAGHLLFLCARLLCHAREECAARRIQRAWRFIHWRPGCLRRWQRAATVVAKHKRALDARRLAFDKMCAVVRSQATWRGLVARRRLKAAVAAATCIQRHVRGKMARDAYADLQFAAMITQTHARRSIARRAYLTLRRHAIRCQAIRRGSVARDKYMEMLWENEAATTIQSAWRMATQRRVFEGVREMTVYIQAMARGATTRRKFVRYRNKVRGATKIQSAFRGYLARTSFNSLRTAAVRAQAIRKGTTERRAFVARRRAAIRIQAAVRGWTARERYNDVRFSSFVFAGAGEGRELPASVPPDARRRAHDPTRLPRGATYT